MRSARTGVGRRPQSSIFGWRSKYLGWQAPTTLGLNELDEFLLARAMEHDSPTLLFRLTVST
jgi:hypothetical protein